MRLKDGQVAGVVPGASRAARVEFVMLLTLPPYPSAFRPVPPDSETTSRCAWQAARAALARQQLNLPAQHLCLGGSTAIAPSNIARRVTSRLRDDFAAPLMHSDADRAWEFIDRR